jgi:hypothetical protein
MSHTRTTLTSAQPLGSRSLVLDHRHIQLNRSSFSLRYKGESSGVSHHLNSLHRGGQCIVLSMSQNDTPNSWASLHKGTQYSISVSERNHTPISWAHPTHEISLKSNHSICVLGDVSRSYNHQQILPSINYYSLHWYQSPIWADIVESL